MQDDNHVTVEGLFWTTTVTLYGQEVRMEFLQVPAPGAEVPDFQALTREVMHNADQTREYFASHPHLWDPVWDLA